jgi:hypothetical protein
VLGVSLSRIGGQSIRRVALGWVAAFALLASAGEVSAQSAECQRLASALSAVDRAGGGRGGQWSSAAREQNDAIRQTQSQMAQMGCGGGAAPAACAPLRVRLQRMQSNLTRLERGATRTGDSGVSERQRILSRMARLNCGATVSPQPPRPPAGFLSSVAPQGMFSTNPRTRAAGAPPPAPTAMSAPAGLIIAPGPGRQPYYYRRDSTGGLIMVGPATTSPAAPVMSAGLSAGVNGGLRIRERSSDSDTGYSDPQPLPQRGGRFRTLCVRKCDGYYFPLSYATSSDRFPQDARLCSALCPAAETGLYTHRTGSEAETMVSADEEQRPYTALPMAFRYRTEVVEGCGCGGVNGGLVPLTLRDSRLMPLGFEDFDAGPAFPEPYARPDLDEDPDTLANRLDRHQPILGDGMMAVREEPVADGPRRIRIVGPSYFYAR